MAEKSQKSQKILTSKDEILDFMRISRKLYDHFIILGLPVVIINGRHYAHVDNVEEWFRSKTMKQASINTPFTESENE